MKTTWKNRLLSLVMAMIMVASMLPATALATNADSHPTQDQLSAIGYSFSSGNDYTITKGDTQIVNFNTGLDSATVLSGTTTTVKRFQHYNSTDGKNYSCLFFALGADGTPRTAYRVETEASNPTYSSCDASAWGTSGETTLFVPQRLEDLYIDSEGYIYVDYQDHNGEQVKYYLGLNGFTTEKAEAKPAETNVSFTVSAGTGGGVSVTSTDSSLTGNGSGSYTVKKGASVTLTPQPDENYKFTSWSGSNTTTTNPLTVTIQGNESYTANFALKSFTVTLNGVNTAQNNYGSKTVTSGQVATFTEVKANAGYYFAANAVPGGSFTGTPDANGIHAGTVTYTATSDKTLTITANPYATLKGNVYSSTDTTIPTSGTVQFGAAGNISTPTQVPAGVTVKDINGTNTNAGGKYITVASGVVTVQSDLTVSSNVTNATANPSGSQTVSYGGTANITVTAKAGYYFLANTSVSGWTDNLAADGETVTFTKTNITASTTLTVAATPYAAKVTTGGTTTYHPSYTKADLEGLTSGSTVQFGAAGNISDPAQVPTGVTVKDINGTAPAGVTAGDYITVANGTITEVSDLTVSSSVTNATANPSSPQQVQYNGSASIAVTAKAGYYFPANTTVSGWTDNLAADGETVTFMKTGIKQDVTLTVSATAYAAKVTRNGVTTYVTDLTGFDWTNVTAITFGAAGNYGGMVPNTIGNVTELVNGQHVDVTESVKGKYITVTNGDATPAADQVVGFSGKNLKSTPPSQTVPSGGKATFTDVTAADGYYFRAADAITNGTMEDRQIITKDTDKITVVSKQVTNAGFTVIVDATAYAAKVTKDGVTTYKESLTAEEFQTLTGAVVLGPKANLSQQKIPAGVTSVAGYQTPETTYTGDKLITVAQGVITAVDPVAKWEGTDGKTELYPAYPFTMPTTGTVTIITAPETPQVVTVPAGVQLVGKGENGGTVTGEAEALITTEGKVIEIKKPITDPDITGKVTDPDTGKVTITVEPVDPDFKYVVVDPETGAIVDTKEPDGTNDEWKTPGEGGEPSDKLTFGPLDPGKNYQVVAVPKETPTDDISEPTKDPTVGPQTTEYPFVTPVTPTVKPSDTLIKPEGGKDYLVVPGEETKPERDYALAVKNPDGTITVVTDPTDQKFGWQTGTGEENNDLTFGPLEELEEGKEYVIVESGKYTGDPEETERDPHIFDPDTVDKGWGIEAPDPAEVTGRTAQSITVKPKEDEAYQVVNPDGESAFYRVVTDENGEKAIQKQDPATGEWAPYEEDEVTLTSTGNLTFKGLEKDKEYEIFNKRLEEDENGKLIESPMTESKDSTSQVSADEIAKAFDKDVVTEDGEDDVVDKAESEVVDVTVDPDGNYVVTLKKDVTAAETGAGEGKPTVTIPDTWGEVTIDQGEFDIKGQNGTAPHPDGTQGIVFTKSNEPAGKGTDLTITATDGEIIGGDGYGAGEGETPTEGGKGGDGIGITGTGDPNDIKLTITDGKVTGGQGGEGTTTGGEGGDGITGPFVVETEETVITGGNGGKGGTTGGEGGEGIKTSVTICPEGVENPVKVTGGAVTGGNGGEGGEGGQGGGGITTTDPAGPDKPILVTGGGQVTGGNGGKGGQSTEATDGGKGGEGGSGITGGPGGITITGGSVTGGEGGDGGKATGTGTGGEGGKGGEATTCPGNGGITITGPGSVTGGNGGEGGSSSEGAGGEGGAGGSVCPGDKTPTITTGTGGVDLIGGNGGNGGDGKTEGGNGGEGGKIPTCPPMQPGMIVTGGSGGEGGGGTTPGTDGKAESVTMTSTTSSITATSESIVTSKQYVAVDKDGKVYGPVTPTEDGKVTIPGLSADTWYQLAEAEVTPDPEGGADVVTPGTPVGAIMTAKRTGGGTSYPKPIITTEGGDGKVTISPKNPGPGNKVYITVAPEEGKTVDKITVTTKSGEELVLTDEGDGVYSYTQPAGKELPVEILVTFKDVTGDPYVNGVADLLIVDDHIAYMMGDVGGNFRPQSDITRAEVAQMFYRLLRDKNVTGSAAFDDVAGDAWYSEAVLALANLDIVQGVGGGSFAPDRAITRAEFVAIAVRFADMTTGKVEYSDVSENFWAYEYIGRASYYGWINGYTDGTFKPNNPISRAEAAKVVNTMLARKADMEYVEAHIDELRIFPDVAKTHWAYDVILEATNAHDFTRTDGVEYWDK